MLPVRPGLSRQLSAAAMQVPMISAPQKQTNEIDWVAPIKQHIRHAYGDDPESYNEECDALNRLRQDMRGAGRDSAAGRDLLYRYYGQLELLDLRFPVDENHIKISFTWFDAFTHKPTSQFSLAYEKASIIFNISAVLSCHAANQNRHEDTGLKTAYHSFQASAGMFTYINENFLHAPSMDLSRETVKTLIHIMLAQGQEVFIEKQVMDKKKPGLIAKLAAQAAYLYAQAVEGVQDNVSRAIFERVWLLVVQIKQHHIASVAQYYQAVADYEANKYGEAIARLTAAQNAAKEAIKLANAFPGNVPSNSNLVSETGGILLDMSKKQAASITELQAEYNRDNDMIYHQPVPSSENLGSIPKLPAAKAIPVSELYQGQDIHRIIGPDIFSRIVPMSVTESASLYDEEKAKVGRAEAERVDVADQELAAAYDYLRLPASLNIIRGTADQESMGVDGDFRNWCEELAGHSPFSPVFDRLRDDKGQILNTLDGCMKQLDMEESVCEKMRSKYGAEWTQQPSSRLTQTLRTDARSYRTAVEEAATSDAQLYASFRQYEGDMEEMRSAGETDEADVLYQRAMAKAGAGKKGGMSPSGEGSLLDDDFESDSRESVAEQLERVEGIMKTLQLVKRDRTQVLKDLKEKIRTDDISSVLILNKKAITNQEHALFKTELEKFRPYQVRIMQAVHKQTSLVKELKQVYDLMLADKRVKKETDRYHGFSRQKNTVVGKYRKVWQAYKDLQAGLDRARQFYAEMQETCESLKKNVEAFVENRRSEGGQLLSSIEAAKSNGASKEQERLNAVMERMRLSGGSGSPAPPPPPPSAGFDRDHRPAPLQSQTSWGSQPPTYNPAASPPITPRYPPTNGNGMQSPAPYPSYQQSQQNNSTAAAAAAAGRNGTYNPNSYPAMSPPPHQQQFSPPPSQSQYGNFQQPQQQQQYPPQNQQQQQQQQQPQYGQQPQYSQPQQSYQLPPPPPGPPPTGDYSAMQAAQYPAGPGGYAHDPRRSQPQQQQQQQQQQNGGPASGDLWGQLGSWK